MASENVFLYTESSDVILSSGTGGSFAVEKKSTEDKNTFHYKFN